MDFHCAHIHACLSDCFEKLYRQRSYFLHVACAKRHTSLKRERGCHLKCQTFTQYVLEQALSEGKRMLTGFHLMQIGRELKSISLETQFDEGAIQN